MNVEQRREKLYRNIGTKPLEMDELYQLTRGIYLSEEWPRALMRQDLEKLCEEGRVTRIPFRRTSPVSGTDGWMRVETLIAKYAVVMR